MIIFTFFIINENQHLNIFSMKLLHSQQEFHFILSFSYLNHRILF